MKRVVVALNIPFLEAIHYFDEKENYNTDVPRWGVTNSSIGCDGAIVPGWKDTPIRLTRVLFENCNIHECSMYDVPWGWITSKDGFDVVKFVNE